MKPSSLTLAALLAAAMTACADAPRDDAALPESASREEEADSSTVAPAPAPDTDPVARWAARLPQDLLRRSGACPFECCVYGEWQADSRIALQARPGGEESAARGQLEPGTEFRADSGFVRVIELALVAVTDTVTPMVDRSLAPGDTLVLLDYVGEGFHNVWLNGEVVEVADFWSTATDRPRGQVLGEHQTEWWVHATTDAVSGWFRADEPGVELSGVDACG